MNNSYNSAAKKRWPNIRIFKNRVYKEIEAIKKQYPTVVQSGDAGEILVIIQPSFIRTGKAIVVIVEIPENYPFRAPKIQIAGYSITRINPWSAGDALPTTLSKLFDELRDAENSPVFRRGDWFEGKNYGFRNVEPKNSTQYMFTISCEVCGENAENKCSQCESVYYCGVKCQATDWNTHFIKCLHKTK